MAITTIEWQFFIESFNQKLLSYAPINFTFLDMYIEYINRNLMTMSRGGKLLHRCLFFFRYFPIFWRGPVMIVYAVGMCLHKCICERVYLCVCCCCFQIIKFIWLVCVHLFVRLFVWLIKHIQFFYLKKLLIWAKFHFQYQVTLFGSCKNILDIDKLVSIIQQLPAYF